jgi:hypothetical protein
MIVNSRDWILVTGKAFTGKTHFIREHMKVIPKTRRVYIYDFTAEYGDLASKKNFGVWQVRRGTQTEIEEFTGRIYNEGNCTVVMSESDNYLQMNSPVLLAFVTTGRNRGINAIIDAKRPMSVKPAYRGRFNHLILFQTTLPDDIEYLEDWTGSGKGSLQKLTTLKQGEYLHVNLNTQEISDIKRL